MVLGNSTLESFVGGYVHTNKFASEQEIEKELFDRYGEVEYKTVEYKTGRYKRGWVKM